MNIADVVKLPLVCGCIFIMALLLLLAGGSSPAYADVQLTTNFPSPIISIWGGAREAMAPSTCRIWPANFASTAMESGNSSPTDTADFGPDLEVLGPSSSVLGGSDMIAAEMEEVVDLIMA